MTLKRAVEEKGPALAPAQRLSGFRLDGGWFVIAPVQPTKGGTGGTFSQGYLVQNEAGEKAFLKALDFSSALDAPDPARALQALTEAYNFERDVLFRCKDRRLSKVVLPLADGSVKVSDEAIGVVQYIIFDLAECDVRAQMAVEDGLTLAWIARCLHNLAVGLKQLHSSGVAHQDLKPSNALRFPDNQTKLGDLGRAAAEGEKPPHHENSCAGDRTYAPPELLYRQVADDWNIRRLGCDVYLLGSMATFFFCGLSMTALIMKNLDATFHWSRWRGPYGDVLPYVRDAFERSLGDLENSIPEVKPVVGELDYRGEMVMTVRQLCEPDPALRGHPLNRASGVNPFSLDRYISRFDLMARQAEFGLTRVSR